MMSKQIPAHTMLSVMGYLAGNHGSGHYGKLCISPDERKRRKKKEKIAKASKKRNRRK